METPLAGDDGPENATAFCNQTMAVTCDKVFECVPQSARTAEFVAQFGESAAACKTKLQAESCPTAAAECPNYNASAGATCVSKISSSTCAQIADEDLPAECETACPGAT